MIFLRSTDNWIEMSLEFPPFSSFFPSSEEVSKRCKPGECRIENKTLVFKGNLNDTMWKILPMLNATHAFVNVGWAGMKGHAPSPMPQFSCKINEFTLRHPNIKISYITHVPERDYTRNMSNPTISDTMECKIDVLDRFPTAENVPKNWYYDYLHVGSALKREYNHQLLESLCPLSNF